VHCTEPLPAAAIAWAERQAGVLTRSQLTSFGLHDSQVARLVRGQVLQRLDRGVYVLGALEPTWHQYACSTTRRELGTTDRRLRRRVSRPGRSAPANPARRRLDEWACFTAVDDCGPTAARGPTVPLPRVATADCGWGHRAGYVCLGSEWSRRDWLPHFVHSSPDKPRKAETRLGAPSPHRSPVADQRHPRWDSERGPKSAGVPLDRAGRAASSTTRPHPPCFGCYADAATPANRLDAHVARI